MANSDAQKEMMGDGGREMDDATRKASAELVWQNERGFSALVLVAGWFLKVIALLGIVGSEARAHVLTFLSCSIRCTLSS